jgi:hypothetical protein
VVVSALLVPQQPIIFIQLFVMIRSMSQRVCLQKLGGLGPLD